MLDQSNGINYLNKILQEIVFKQLCQLLNFMDFALFHFPYPELPFCKLQYDLSFSEVKIHLPFKRKKKTKPRQTNKQTDKKPQQNKPKQITIFFFLKMLDIHTCEHIPDICPQVPAKSLKVKKCLLLFLEFANSRHLSCLVTLHLH